MQLERLSVTQFSSVENHQSLKWEYRRKSTQRSCTCIQRPEHWWWWFSMQVSEVNGQFVYRLTAELQNLIVTISNRVIFDVKLGWLVACSGYRLSYNFLEQNCGLFLTCFFLVRGRLTWAEFLDFAFHASRQRPRSECIPEVCCEKPEEVHNRYNSVVLGCVQDGSILTKTKNNNDINSFTTSWKTLCSLSLMSSSYHGIKLSTTNFNSGHSWNHSRSR